MPQLMGIGPIGTSNNVIFKRKFRWTFEVQDVCAGGNNLGNIPSSYVKLAARPNISFDETEINFLQGKMFIPGKATFETVTVTYYDITPVKSDTILNLYNWIGSVYDFLGQPTAGNNQAGSWLNPRMSSYGNGAGGYGGTGVLNMYDGGGVPLEQWTLYTCWPQSVNFGDLDYSASDECNIELTLRYTFAKWRNICGDQQPNPCYRGCSV